MRCAVTGLAAGVAVVMVLGACSTAKPRVETRATSTSSAVSPAAGLGATAGLAGGSPAVSSTAASPPCTVTVGSQLRERTTVTPGGSVMMLAGSMPCRPVGVWAGSFALDGSAAADPAPTFVGAYTGTKTLSATLPTVGARCSASAVWFTAGTAAAKDLTQAETAAAAIRDDLTAWPADQEATVPGAAILQGRPSGVLAAAVTGDPARCSPGPSLASPVAAVGDCWLASPAAAAPSAAPGTPRTGAPSPTAQAAGFRPTTCGAPHTHEVYWVENLTPQAYLRQRTSDEESATAWARRHADQVCAAQLSSLELAGDVKLTDIALEKLWPSTLEYPPATATAWSKAQIVCLARWKDGKPSDRHLMHR